MTINIQYVQMPTSESLNGIVTRNLKKLGHKYQFVIRADVFFKLENDPRGKGNICEIQLSAPGPRLFAKSDENNFEKAAAATIADLERQLKKRKGKFNEHRKSL
ncbi:HPF/RaiA family ribosome-associated protein [Flavobacteriaceae bacterium TP-CH-4]|uniref:HPF/RaiA family ribosome-associated protein n=1 Tax=Pelagihabitans pacificus TaxID=2696054 RepID=A0A967ATG8_9FLAO|nr:HPF/RaiA family ribosome-associated protein [Pelagihabitans pacificus]NHF59709.1 HPF/RaiA family ribosome-associated protein [Pelagihabitans pacificus]